jgi:hypothetical protein
MDFLAWMLFVIGVLGHLCVTNLGQEWSDE